MACRLKNNEKEQVIEMNELSHGQLGIIVKSEDEFKEWDGKIVIACIDDDLNNYYQILGEADYFDMYCNYLVRILQPGELIEVDYE